MPSMAQMQATQIRQQLRGRQGLGRGSAVQVTPSPVGGWNVRDPLDAMPAIDAQLLDNWFPDIGKVTLRRGYVVHATNVGAGEVESIMSLDNGPVKSLLAAEGGDIYDVTVPGSAGVPIGTGFSNARWQDINVQAILLMFNGADTPQEWDGTTLTPVVFTSSSGQLDPTDLIGSIVYNNRLFCWEVQTGANPRSWWYSDLNATAGVLREFDVSTVVGFQGNILTMGIWSRDAGDGLDDLLVTIMTSGTTMIWTGTDPGDVTAWDLVGVYDTGLPLGIRSILNQGGELIIGTATGYVPVSGILQGGNQAVAISDKISGQVRIDARQGGTLFGWDAILTEDGNELWFNVPKQADVIFDQHIRNNQTGAWTRYTGIPAICLVSHSFSEFAGSTGGQVIQLNTSTTDDGTAIITDARTAPQRLGGPQGVRVTAVRPTLTLSSNVLAGIDIEVDFGQSGIGAGTYVLTGASNASTPWESLNTVLWENFSALWNDELVTYNRWLSVFGFGFAINVRFVTASDATIDWFSTAIAYEIGGPI